MARAYRFISIAFLTLAACAVPPREEASDTRSYPDAQSSPNARALSNPRSPEVVRQVSGTESLIVGVDALDENIVWASGTGGTFLRTVDGGAAWHSSIVPGADSLQFRDVHAVSADEALLLSIGRGDASRIYRTNDGGLTWEMEFVSNQPEAFFDCFAFWDDGAGVAFSDAIGGRFPMITKSSSDAPWSYIEETPRAQQNEGGFAASGTCVVTQGDGGVLIGTGNAERARVLRSMDRGRSWTAVDVPVYSGDAAGIATLAFRDEAHGAALGGDIAQPDSITNNVAVTSDGGQTWTPRERTPFRGAVYGSAYAPGSDRLVAVGPGGAAFSTDDAASWTMLDSLAHWSVDFGSATLGWMVGPQGRVSKITF